MCVYTSYYNTLFVSNHYTALRKEKTVSGSSQSRICFVDGTQPGIPLVCVMAVRRPWKGLSFRPLMCRHVPEAAEHEPTAPGEHQRQI